MVDIEGYEGLYAITEDGNVWSYRRNKFLIAKMSNCGYMRVVLSKNNVTTNYSVHRLVAKAYIPNPNNYPCVNHKDENKLNNCVENLEWCTHKYNRNYGTLPEKLKGRKFSEATKQKISDALKGNHNALGVKRSEEYKQKLSQSKLGHEVSKATREKLSKANKGRTISEETKHKMREASKLRQKPVLCIETRKIFESIAQAHQITNINGGHISDCCNGKRKTAGGYHWKFVDNLMIYGEVKQ